MTIEKTPVEPIIRLLYIVFLDASGEEDAFEVPEDTLFKFLEVNCPEKCKLISAEIIAFD